MRRSAPLYRCMPPYSLQLPSRQTNHRLLLVAFVPRFPLAEAPPSLGGDVVELPEERAARRGGRSPDIEWRTDVTYTMCFHRYCATRPSRMRPLPGFLGRCQRFFMKIRKNKIPHSAVMSRTSSTPISASYVYV